MTKTIRSPFNHEVGGAVEGCTILEKRVVIPPDPVERRRGVYDYVVNVPPLPARTGAAQKFQQHGFGLIVERVSGRNLIQIVRLEQ